MPFLLQKLAPVPLALAKGTLKLAVEPAALDSNPDTSAQLGASYRTFSASLFYSIKWTTSQAASFRSEVRMKRVLAWVAVSCPVHR